jgi:hypothetical protein
LGGGTDPPFTLIPETGPIAEVGRPLKIFGKMRFQGLNWHVIKLGKAILVLSRQVARRY